MTDFTGVTRIEINESSIVPSDINANTIGMAATAPDCDRSFFVNENGTPRVITDIKTALEKCGNTGTLGPALDRIKDEGNPMIKVALVDHSDDINELKANVMGGVANGVYTGIQALRTGGKDGSLPRILGAPGLDFDDSITGALAAVATANGGMAYASCGPAQTKEEAAAYADKFGSRELFLVYPEAKGFDVRSQSDDVALPSVAQLLGLRARIDDQVGWHESIANLPLNGVTDVTQDLTWSLTNPSTDVGYLNQNQINALIINKGVRCWGSRTQSADPQFAYENATRTAHIVGQTLEQMFFNHMSRALSRGRLIAIIGSMNAKMRQWVGEGRLMGGECWLPEDVNTPEVIASRQVYFDFDYTVVPTLENPTLRQRITQRYLVNLTEGLTR